MNSNEYTLDIMKQEINNKYICPEVKYAFKMSIEALEKQIAKETDYKKLEHEKDYWKECYGIAINHLKEIGNQYFIEHGYSFEYKK